MEQRKLGGLKVSAMGLGCMSMSQGYGSAERKESERTLHRALDIGYTFLDTASVYVTGHNESLLGETLRNRRDEFFLASKCGIINKDGKGIHKALAAPLGIPNCFRDSIKFVFRSIPVFITF